MPLCTGCGGGGCWYTEGEEDNDVEVEPTLWKAEVFPAPIAVRLGGRGGGGGEEEELPLLGSLKSYLKLGHNGLGHVKT